MIALTYCRSGGVGLLMSAALLPIGARAENSVPVPPVFQDVTPVIDHHDPIEVDPKLNLPGVVELTLEKFPDMSWLEAQEAEAAAILERSRSWTAGSARADLRFQEATSGTLHYVDATVGVPLWNLGQRDAERNLAERADANRAQQSQAVKLRVAGLVRAALWEMALQKVRYDQAQAEVGNYEQLFAKIQRRVELGDLPRADELLAKTELLQKRATLTLAEAELMHARKRYANITQTTKVPLEFKERLIGLDKIELNHPALAALQSQIERKRAEIDALKHVGSGQTDLMLGINSDRPSRGDERSNNTESFNIAVSVPFGGSAHLQPQIAAANVEAARLQADYQQLYRNLELAHHEAEHNLAVNQEELKIAEEMRQTAEEHLQMMELSFSVGEIDLMDLLKVKSRTLQAILSAKERSVMLQRDIAFYNQAVGVLP